MSFNAFPTVSHLWSLSNCQSIIKFPLSVTKGPAFAFAWRTTALPPKRSSTSIWTHLNPFFNIRIILGHFLVENFVTYISGVRSRTACYSLFKKWIYLVKNVLHSVNMFCVGGPSQKLASDWSSSTNVSYVDSDESVFFFQKDRSLLHITYEFTNKAYTNDSKYENESSLC